MIGDRNANTPPAPAIQRPSVVVMPGQVHDVGEASTAITVMIANLSWLRVAP